MDDTYTEEGRGHRHREGGGVMRMLDGVFDFFVRSLSTIAREAELFIGSALVLVGLLSIEADKFCDGNTADYLSCTRPSTYYFYSPLDIAIIIIGAFLVMLWFLNRRSHR